MVLYLRIFPVRLIHFFLLFDLNCFDAHLHSVSVCLFILGIFPLNKYLQFTFFFCASCWEIVSLHDHIASITLKFCIWVSFALFPSDFVIRLYLLKRNRRRHKKEKRLWKKCVSNENDIEFFLCLVLFVYGYGNKNFNNFILKCHKQTIKPYYYELLSTNTTHTLSHKNNNKYLIWNKPKKKTLKINIFLQL